SLLGAGFGTPPGPAGPSKFAGRACIPPGTGAPRPWPAGGFIMPTGRARIPPGLGAPSGWPVDGFIMPTGKARMPPGTGAPIGWPVPEEPPVLPELFRRMGWPPPQLTTIVPEPTGAGVPLLD